MTVDKNITVDLARIQPHKVIKIHEGDVNSVFVVLTVTNGAASVSLTGLTIKYDAVINNYLAEQDASGSVDTNNNTIRIPVTSNMTAMSGKLRIDVRMKSGTEVLYTQTITMIVEKAVVDGSTVIDFSGITIVQRMNALETQMLEFKTVVIEGAKNLTPDITFNLHNEKVAAYLAACDADPYDPSDYSNSLVPSGIANEHWDHPNGADVSIPTGGVSITLLDTVTGQEWTEVVSGASYRIQNLIPGRVYTYLIRDASAEILESSSCKASGQVRMIDPGTNVDTTDPYNIRDIGGWACDGGTLKYGMIYRGSELNKGVSLSAGQKTVFRDLLGVRDEIDLRSDAQTEGITDTALGIGVGYTHVSIEYYTNIFRRETDAKKCAGLIKRIAQNLREDKVTYIHCQAGADRTACLCMLIEAICGVSQCDVDMEYELTSFSYRYNGSSWEHNSRKRNAGTLGNANWKTMMNIVGTELEGSSFNDKIVRYLLRYGVSIDDINAIRENLINGTPEKLSNPYGSATVTKTLSGVRLSSDATEIEMYQPFVTEIIADNGYLISSLSVTMGGTDVTSSYISQGRISIPSVTGNIVVTAIAEYIDGNFARIEGAMSGIPIYSKKSSWTNGTILTNQVHAYVLVATSTGVLSAKGLDWSSISNEVQTIYSSHLPTGGTITQFDSDDAICVPYYTGDLVRLDGDDKVYRCSLSYDLTSYNLPLVYSYTWEEVDSYTKTEIDTMIGDVETLLSQV